MNKTIFSLFIPFCFLIFSGIALADTCTPEHRDYNCSTVSSDSDADSSVCSCDVEPFEPTPCDLAMKDVWFAAHNKIDHILTQPICKGYWHSWVDVISHDDGAGYADESTATQSKSKYRLIKAKNLRRLKRAARDCR